jgi:carboxymethylenebutenolidase
MCYSDDARVPLPPISGAAADHGDVVLTAADGNRFGAYYARAAEPSGAGMVVMPDVRGLHEFYKDLARKFAEAGVDSVAIDYFGRTAGIGDRSEGFEFVPHVEKTTPEGVRSDVAAAVAHLKSKDGGAVKSTFTVGFCFGGSNSWNQSAGGHGLNGCIGFYGRPARSEPFLAQMKSPLLMLLAGSDAATPQEAFMAFDAKLTAAGVPHDMHIYQGAPHSFFDRTFDQWKDACDDAWRRMLDFIKAKS